MPDGKPTILVIWGDDIGITNLSCYSDGLMGDRSPTSTTSPASAGGSPDSYGEQRCTGMSKVGVPGHPSVGPVRTRRSPNVSRRWATPPGSSARITPATCTTSTARKSRRAPPTPTRTNSLGQDFAFPRGVLKCRATSIGKQILEDMHTTPSRRASVKRACGSRTWPVSNDNIQHHDWFLRRDYFKQFPPRREPASFCVDQAVAKLHKFLAKD
jgi:hypothetical protein